MSVGELTELGRVFCEVLVASLTAKQPSTALQRGALLVVIRGAPVCWTLLFGGNEAALLEDDQVPPGVPRAQLTLTADAVRTMGRGGSIAALAQSDQLAVSGDGRVLNALAEAFKPSGSPLGVRIGSLKGAR
jgi:hypothetical protein